MFQAARVAAVCAIGFMLGVASAAVSSAEPVLGWMVNGTNVTSAALATTAKTDKANVFEGGGLNIECKGNSEAVSPEIKGPASGRASSLAFTECKTANANCEVPTKIGTVPIEVELTLEGTSEVKALFKPSSGTTITTIKFSGEKCAVAGVKPITGQSTKTGPTLRTESTDQLLVINEPANGELKIASSAASLTGSALLLVASRQAWSFL